jgi:hypothetical protein
MKNIFIVLLLASTIYAFDFGSLIKATTQTVDTKQEYNVDGYDKQTSLFMARVADAVFKSDYGKSGFANSAITYDGYYEAKEGLVDLQFAYGHRGDISRLDIFISIRGSKESMDWITDINYISSIYDKNIDNKITVHSGFLNSANLLIASESKAKIYNLTLKEIIEQNINGKRNDHFYITGHSLGGAVATIYSTKLLDRGIKSDMMSIYTFGAPPISMDEGDTKEQMHSFGLEGKVGAITDIAMNSAMGNNTKGTNYYIDRYQNKIKIYRVYDSNDLVPKLLPPARHLGIDVMYSSQISKKDLINKDKMLKLHFMSNYFNLIQNQKPQDPSTKSGGLIDLVN